LSPADSTQVYRFQGVDLKDRFPAPPTDRRVPYTGAKLLSDSTQLDRFFIYASPGIFTVSLPWLKALETFSLEADATLASMTDLESTGVHQALNLMPIRSSGCARIIGAAVLSQPTAGALLDFVTILTETDDQASLPATPSASTDPRAPVQWNCYVVDARQLYKSGLAPPPIAVVNTPNKSKYDFSIYPARAVFAQLSHIKYFHRGRHEVWKLPAPEAPQKIGRTPSESKEAYLWFTKWASEVRKTQVTWVQTADADITSHIDILSQTHSAQAQDLEKLKYEIGLQQQIQDVIEARIKAITDWQLNLTLRADNVLNFINSCQARLSKAEREYFGELETMARSVQALSSRADDSQAKVQSYLESEPSASPAVAAPEGQLKMIEPWVEKQFVYLVSIHSFVSLKRRYGIGFLHFFSFFSGVT
jgi:flagellar capping protein FliD